ncbi:unnamed protein product, partial [Linum tenue]
SSTLNSQKLTLLSSPLSPIHLHRNACQSQSRRESLLSPSESPTTPPLPCLLSLRFLINTSLTDAGSSPPQSPSKRRRFLQWLLLSSPPPPPCRSLTSLLCFRAARVVLLAIPDRHCASSLHQLEQHQYHNIAIHITFDSRTAFWKSVIVVEPM